MAHVFVCIPSARGVNPHTMWCVFDMRTVLEKRGHLLHGTSVYRMPLDLARNEMATAFLSTKPEVGMCLLLDDDVQLVAEEILNMMAAIMGGAKVVSAPCRLRNHGDSGGGGYAPFNIVPNGEDCDTINNVRLLPCMHTGLGAVLVAREVLEKLWETCPHYESVIQPGKQSAAIFTSEVAPAKSFDERAPEGMGIHIMDDIVFSRKVRALGYTIHAAIDVTTVHDGAKGCFAEEAERLTKLQEKVGRPIVGPDGRRLGAP